MPSHSILVVEDDPAIRRGLRDMLSLSGYKVHECGDGPTGLEHASRGTYDLVLLDVMLPGLDGFQVLAQLRRLQPLMPVILLTARGSEEDRVRGLRQGADDYVVKPFSTTELLARVEAVLRRSVSRPQAVDRLEIAGRRVDFERREAHLPDGSSSQLTEREANLLQHLAAHRGRAVSRDELLRCVWGIDPRGVQTRTVDMAVARLRERLGDDSENPAIVVTVRAKGYMLAADGDAPAAETAEDTADEA